MPGLGWAQSEPPGATPVSQEQRPTAQTSDVAAKLESYPPMDDSQLPPGEDPENRLVLPFLKHLANDQRQFWTSPLHFQTKDLKWILPGASVTAAFIASDSWLSKQIPVSHIATSKTISDYSTYSLIGLGGASSLFGHMTHNGHLSRARLVAG